MGRLKVKYTQGTAPEYDLDNGSDRFFVGFTNFGIPGVNHATSKAPNQDGVTHNGFIISERRFSVVLDLVAGSFPELSAKKNQLIGDVHPIRNKPMTLVYMPDPLDESTYREIECYYSGGLELPSKDQEGFEQRIALEFLAPDPVWYDPNFRSQAFTLEPNTELAFPISFPIAFGTSIIRDGATIQYKGTWPAYPTIYLNGPQTAPLIQHETLDLKIEFPSYELVAGDTITIDLDPLKKTVTLNDGTNLIGALSEDSDLGTWRFAPRPEVSDGINNVSVSAGNATADSNIQFVWHPKYLGV